MEGMMRGQQGFIKGYCWGTEGFLQGYQSGIMRYWRDICQILPATGAVGLTAEATTGRMLASCAAAAAGSMPSLRQIDSERESTGPATIGFFFGFGWGAPYSPRCRGAC